MNERGARYIFFKPMWDEYVDEQKVKALLFRYLSALVHAQNHTRQQTPAQFVLRPEHEREIGVVSLKGQKSSSYLLIYTHFLKERPKLPSNTRNSNRYRFY